MRNYIHTITVNSQNSTVHFGRFKRRNSDKVYHPTPASIKRLTTAVARCLNAGQGEIELVDLGGWRFIPD